MGGVTGRTLVATVGFSPSAVALAACTLFPDEVVLVHTTTSRPDAERLERMLPELGIPSVRRLCCGTGRDLAETWDQLSRGLADLRAYRLDHTGGTKLVAACAVRRHIADHGEPGDALRSCVDDASGRIMFDGGRAPVPLATDRLTIERVAELHGFALRGHVVRRPSAVVDPALVAEALAHPHSGEADALRTRLLNQLAPEQLGRGAKNWVRGVRGAGRSGAVVEMVVAAAVASLPDIDELAMGVAVPEGGGNAAEFDLVLRRGHRIVALEVKESLREASADVAGMRAARDRVVFGSTARTGLVVRRTAGDDDLWAGIRAAVADLGAPLLGDRLLLRGLDPLRYREDRRGLNDEVGRLLGASVVPTPFRDRVEAPARPIPQPAPASGVTSPPDYDDLIVPVSGTALGVAAALRAARARRVRMIGPNAVRRELRTRYLTGGDHHDRDLGEIRRIGDILAELPLEPGQTALTISPSTKAVTAALVRSAALHGHDLLHTALDGTVQSWRYGRWSHPEPVDWEEHFGGLIVAGELPDRPPAGHDLVRLRAIQAVGNHADARWLVTAMPAAAWLPPLLRVDRHRCLAMLAPADPDGEGRAIVLAVETFLLRTVGDAAALHVVLPDSVAEVGAWQRLQRRSALPWRLLTAAGRDFVPRR